MLRHSRLSQRLDKIERSLLSTDNPSQLWLRRALSFKSAADYAAWFSDPAKSATAVAIFERQVLNVMNSASRRGRWSQSKLQFLRGIVLSLRVFVELNLECAQGCDQLYKRLRDLADEAGEIFPELCGKDRPAHFNSETPWLVDYILAMPGLAHHFAVDWFWIERICEIGEKKVRAGDNPGGLLQQLKSALGEGILEEGQMVLFLTIPIPELREVPLVDGEWIDVFFIALARYGARLKPRGGKPSPAEAKELWEEALGALDKSRAETKLIGGRPHIRLSDYASQPDPLDYEICVDCITLNSLLGWCDAAGARARGAETNNSATQPGTGLTDGAADAPPAPPASAVTCLARKMSPEPASRAQEWAERLKSLVSDLNELSGLAGDCGRTHFGGRSALFPEVAFRLHLLILLTRPWVDVCNAAADLNLIPFSCYIERADEKIRNIQAADKRAGELTERAEEKVRLAERRPTWSPPSRVTV